MAFLISVASTSTTTIAVASSIPVAFASSIPVAFASSSSSSFRSIRFCRARNVPFLCSSIQSLFPNPLGLTRSFSQPHSALNVAGSTSEEKPSSQTEYMVNMKCEVSVNTVNNKMETVNDFLISAAVAEFKGPDIFGVVRLAQVNLELVRIEANFSGLSPGKHGWSINEFGDLTRGAASTGKMFNPTSGEPANEPVGDLGTLEADEKGEAYFSGVDQKLRVADLVGRSIAVYGTEDKSDFGIAAAVIAISAGVGKNCKRLCACDGTTIWDATNNDFGV